MFNERFYPITGELQRLEIASWHAFFRACEDAGVAPFYGHWIEMEWAGLIPSLEVA